MNSNNSNDDRWKELTIQLRKLSSRWGGLTEDIVQEVLYRMLLHERQGGETIRDTVGFGVAIGKNVYLEELRKQKRGLNLPLEFYSVWYPSDEPSLGDIPLAELEDIRKKALSTSERKTFDLYFGVRSWRKKGREEKLAAQRKQLAEKLGLKQDQLYTLVSKLKRRVSDEYQRRKAHGK